LPKLRHNCPDKLNNNRLGHTSILTGAESTSNEGYPKPDAEAFMPQLGGAAIGDKNEDPCRR
jgi:hypothetical protein